MEVFAHYWGIDEVGVFVIPAVLGTVALRWAEKKARAKRDEDSRQETSHAD